MGAACPRWWSTPKAFRAMPLARRAPVQTEREVRAGAETGYRSYKSWMRKCSYSRRECLSCSVAALQEPTQRAQAGLLLARTVRPRLRQASRQFAYGENWSMRYCTRRSRGKILVEPLAGSPLLETGKSPRPTLQSLPHRAFTRRERIGADKVGRHDGNPICFSAFGEFGTHIRRARGRAKL